MEDPTKQQDPAQAGATHAEPTDAERAQVDWKRECRKWERLAKENKAKADRLNAIEKQGKTELQRAQEEARSANEELERMRADRAHADLVASVSASTGVPAQLLHGDTEEELAASAAAVSAYVESKAPVLEQCRSDW